MFCGGALVYDGTGVLSSESFITLLQLIFVSKATESKQEQMRAIKLLTFCLFLPQLSEGAKSDFISRPTTKVHKLYFLTLKLIIIDPKILEIKCITKSRNQAWPERYLLRETLERHYKYKVIFNVPI